jgi:hypothetical protein
LTSATCRGTASSGSLSPFAVIVTVTSVAVIGASGSQAKLWRALVYRGAFGIRTPSRHLGP